MEVSVNLLVDKGADFDLVLAQARKAGLTVSAVHAPLRIASGTVAKAGIPLLSRIAGVKTVEEDRDVGMF